MKKQSVIWFLAYPMYPLCHKEQLMSDTASSVKSNVGTYLKRLMPWFCPAVTDALNETFYVMML